ncbi:multidrug efflux SMR transporter [Synechococcus sp. HK01-R]|jgi:small multidrug resistance pump|nr:multidrug efflux SMR transporter [Synechococcus sp. HK01-R]
MEAAPGPTTTHRRRWLALVELFLAIAAEQVGTSAMKASNGFSQLLPTLLAIAGYSLSMLWFGRSMRVLPMGFAYALWVGIGMVVASVIGIVIFSELMTPAVIVGLLFVFVGILVLNSAQQEVA